MKSKEFLKERLFRIFSSIQNITVQYQHFKEKKLHLVQITPSQKTFCDQNYIVLKQNLIRDFNHKFPDEELAFMNDNNHLNITSPEFSFSKIRGKSVIETRSLNYSPSFTLRVTEDVNKIRSL